MELFIALSLLLAPLPDNVHDYNLPTIRKTIAKLAIKVEIMDEREEDMLLNENGMQHGFVIDFKQTLLDLRERLENLKDAPGLEDHKMFGSYDDLKAGYTVNRSFNNYLQNNKMIIIDYNKVIYDDAIAENDYIGSVYNTAMMAANPVYYTWTRRLELKKLHDMIGAKYFYSGTLPPCIPTWRLPKTGKFVWEG